MRTFLESSFLFHEFLLGAIFLCFETQFLVDEDFAWDLVDLVTVFSEKVHLELRKLFFLRECGGDS